MWSALADWWFDRSSWARYGIALLLIGISTAMFFAGTIWPWGWGAGLGLLVIAGRSNSEKSGYNF